MHKSNFDTKTKNHFTDTETSTFSNCHRTGSKHNGSPKPDDQKTDSDQDSSNSKYVVENDKRERKDGPGGD